MPILHPIFRPLARLGVLTAGVCLSICAFADEPAQPESPPEKHASFLDLGSRVQELGSTMQGLGGRATELAMSAFSLLGTNYARGGTTPEEGMDCSGMVRYVFKQAWGAILPRSAVEMSRVGKIIQEHDLKPGDLVFYNTMRRGFSHVGIYLGNNQFIHSPAAGGKVRIESMNLAYWKQRFNGARRVEEPQR